MNFFVRRYSAYVKKGLRSDGQLKPIGWVLRILLVLYFVAGALVLGARWFVTTQLDHYREDFDAVISSAAGVSFQSRSLNAGFRGVWPVVTLVDVSIARPDGPVSLRLPAIRAEFSWSSLLHLEPRFRTLVISKPHLTIRRLAEKRFDVAGFTIDVPESKDSDEERGVNAEQRFTAWLLAQEQVVIREGAFTYIDETREKQLPIEIRETEAIFEQNLLDWRAAVAGTVTEKQGRRKFELKSRVEKHFLSKEDNPLSWRGEAYAHFDRINVARLAKSADLQRFISSGFGAARLWVAFDRGRITSVTSDVALSHVRLPSRGDLEPLSLSRLRGRISYASDAPGEHRLSAENLNFRLADGTRFGPSNLGFECTSGTNGSPRACSFTASEIRIGTLLDLAPSLPIPNDARRMLGKRDASGTFSQVRASFNGDPKDPTNWAFNLGFRGLTLSPDESGGPSFRNLSGELSTAGPGRFSLKIESRFAGLSFPGIFRHPNMNFDRLEGQVDIQFEPQLRLAFRDVVAVNRDAHVTGSGSWIATGGPGTLDIAGKILSANGAAVHKYLPLAVGDPALDYVESAVIAGRSSRGTFVVRGPLAEFPWQGFDPKQALFRIEADVEGGRLDFMPSHRRIGSGRFQQAEYWPVLNGISAHLRFEGNGMFITGHSGTSEGLKARNVRVDIRNFSADPPELRVQGDISGDLSNALRYLRRTPMLRSIWNDAFDASEGRGPVETALSLVVPLEDDPHVRYSVRSHISSGEFRYADRLPWIQGLSGELLVTEREVSTPNAFEGKTSGGPVKVSARTANGIVELHASGMLASADLPVLCLGPNVRMPIFDELSGTSPFETTIRIPLSADGPVRVSARSDLKGLSSHLPAPLAKNAGDAIPSSLELAFTHSGLQQIFFDMTRTGVVDLDLSKPIPKGFLAVGTARRTNSEGVEADIELPRFDPNYWKHLLTAERVNPNLQTSASASSNPESNFFDALMTAFRKGRIKTEVLSAYGKEFKHVEANVYSQGPHWLASIQSEDISGTVEFEEAQDEAPLSLTMKLQRLHIPDTAAEDLDGLIRPQHVDRRRKLPNLSLRIDDLKIGTRRIGKVELMAGYKFPKTSIGPWEIQRLSVFNVGGSLHGTGRWLPDDLGGKTTIHLRGEVEDAGRTLQSLDIREVVRRAPGSFTAELSWKGPITEFNTETLCGNIRLDAQRGSLLQVEPGAGRILSLLSMQHLLRRLQLDFRDVVSRGFDFDAIHSSGTLTDGIFHTEKTTVVGSSAAIVIGGNIDFVRDTLDLKALVLPSINAEGASLALAIANPAIGISTLIAQWMLKDQISELFSTEYVVSGTFAEPTLEKVDLHHDAKTAPKN